MRNTSSQPRTGQPRRLFTKQPAAALQSREERIADVIADLGLPSPLDPHFASTLKKVRTQAEQIVDADLDGLVPEGRRDEMAQAEITQDWIAAKVRELREAGFTAHGTARSMSGHGWRDRHGLPWTAREVERLSPAE